MDTTGYEYMYIVVAISLKLWSQTYIFCDKWPHVQMHISLVITGLGAKTGYQWSSLLTGGHKPKTGHNDQCDQLVRPS